MIVLGKPHDFLPHNNKLKEKLLNLKQFHFLCYNRHLPNKCLPSITTSYRQLIRSTIGCITHCYNTRSFSAGCTFSCVFVIFFFCQTSTVKLKAVSCLETSHSTNHVFVHASLGNAGFIIAFLSILCSLPFSKAFQAVKLRFDLPIKVAKALNDIDWYVSFICKAGSIHVLLSFGRPRANDSNISTRHIPTLLAEHLQAPAKRSQQLNATDRNIVGRNMLHAFWPPWWHVLRHVASWISNYMPGCNTVGRTWPNDHNIMQHPQMFHERFDHFQIRANNSQHVATRRKRVVKRTQHVAHNNVAICCDRLAGA